MITVRVPDEIRKYKEKLAFGLTLRQIISITITAAVCVPLWFYGRNFMSTDMISWIILFISLPLLSIGFFKFKGMPMEKFAVALLLHEFIYPQKRLFRSFCAFKRWGNIEKAQEIPSGFFAKRAYFNRLREEALERTVLMQEANERGELLSFDAKNVDLLTVRKKSPKGNGLFGFFGGNGDSSGGENGDGDKKKKNKTPKVQIIGEALEAKIEADPECVLTSKERNQLKAWNNYRHNQRKKELNKKKNGIIP